MDEQPQKGPPASAPNLRWRVYEYLKAADRPMNADELSGPLDKPPYTIMPRLTELRDRGLIWDSGERRPTGRGGKSTCWTHRRPVNLPPPAQPDLFD